MNAAVEINKSTWSRYCNDLSRDYQGWAVTIEMLDPELGDQHEVDGLPLQGFSFETQGSQAGDILINVGELGTAFQTYLVHRPTVIRAANLSPSEVDIEIESADGPTRLIRLRSRPELPPA